MKTILSHQLQAREVLYLKRLYKSLLILLFTIFVSYAAEACNDIGSILIKVLDKENNEAIPFANVVAYKNGVQVEVGTTNFDGEFLFRSVAPGKYDVKAIYVGYLAQVIKDVEIGASKTTSLNLKLEGNAIVCYDVTYCCCCFGGYNGYSGENWWPKLWTPYREAYKTWKEKKDKKKVIAAKQPKKEIKLSEEPDETETIDSSLIARVAQIEPVKEQMKIYPNPASDVLHIESAQLLQNIILLNAEGKMVREEIMQNTSTEISLNGFSSGVYYLNYVLNGKTESKKIVVITP